MNLTPQQTILSLELLPGAALNRLAARILFISGLILAGAASSLGQGRITFDGPPIQPPDTSYGIWSYTEAGMSFSPLPDDLIARAGSGIAGRPDNGTAYLNGGALAFEFMDGTPFRLVSVQLAGYSTFLPDFSVDFVGYLARGGTLTTNFFGTGLAFQTFQFGPAWSGLTRVEVPRPDYPWSLDNLTYDVPEPSAARLTAIGSLCLAVHVLKRTRNENGVRSR